MSKIMYESEISKSTAGRRTNHDGYLLVGNITKYACLSLGAGLTILVFLWMLSTSFKLPSDITTIKLSWIPRPFTFSNYITIFKRYPFAMYILNSFFVTSAIVVSCLFFSSLAGFSLAKYKFPGNQLVFVLALVGFMVPNEITMVPLFLLVGNFGLIDS